MRLRIDRTPRLSRAAALSLPWMTGGVSVTENMEELLVDAYGVSVRVRTNAPDVLKRVVPRLPPGWTSSTRRDADQEITFTTQDGFYFDLALDGEGVAAAVELDVALDVLEVKLRFHIAQHAPDFIFVHAGVVGHRGKAILVPGPSFSGKTTLVCELVRAGANYYSDDYAPLDRTGLVHPYAKPLSLRAEGEALQVDHDVGVFGGAAGEVALPVGLVVVSPYHPGAIWDPEKRTAGEGVLALLANTVPAQERPQESMKALTAALGSAVVLEGERGEAREIVQQILESVPS
jgi:hypothetical protein